MLVQVPPSAGLPSAVFHSSMQAVLRPSCAARIAPGWAAGRRPLATTSNVSAIARDVTRATPRLERGPPVRTGGLRFLELAAEVDRYRRARAVRRARDLADGMPEVV